MGIEVRGFGLEASPEELRLRRLLLFRLLDGFDFDAPVFHGEMITEPAPLDQRGEIWGSGLREVAEIRRRR